MIRAIILALLLSVAARAATLVDNFEDVEFWVGSGPNRAVLVIDWQDDKYFPGTNPSPATNQSIVWGYRWSGTATGIDMLRAIGQAAVFGDENPTVGADSRLVLQFSRYGSGSAAQFLFGAYYDLDGDGGTAQFDRVGEEGSASDADDHFMEGITINGYWRYFIGAQTGEALPLWIESRTGAGTRTLVDGSWDAWVFTDYALVSNELPNPSPGVAAPIPEPQMSLFSLAGVALVFGRARFR